MLGPLRLLLLMTVCVLAKGQGAAVEPSAITLSLDERLKLAGYPKSTRSLDEIRTRGSLVLVSGDLRWCALIWHSPWEGIGYGDAVVYRWTDGLWAIHKAAVHVLFPEVHVEGNAWIVTRAADLNNKRRVTQVKVRVGSTAVNRAAQVLFEGLAKDMRFGDWGAFLYDRPSGHLGTETAEHDRWMTSLRQLSQRPTGDILPLLKHPESRVRALALAALFHKEDPAMLPHIQGLADDQAPAIPEASSVSIRGLREEGKPYLIAPITVGRMAKLMIRFWLEAAESEGRPFDDYWRERKDRQTCASWFLARYERATGGTVPVPEDRHKQVRALRGPMGTLQEPDRSLTLLALSEKDKQRILAAEEEYLSACRTLGRPALLNLLKGTPGSADPDFQSKPGKPAACWEAACRFILEHAKTLLEAKDADLLAALSKGQPSPWWAIAASRLDPKTGPEVLKQAIPGFPGTHQDGERALLAGELWRIAGQEEAAYLMDLFFSGKGAHLNGYSFRGHLVKGVHDQGLPVGTKRFIRTLLRDPRSETILWFDFLELVTVCNQLAGEALVTETERNEMESHLMGSDWSEDRGFQRAKQEYPEECRTVEATLGQWRERLLAYSASQGW